ncbi:MAG: ABC transporter permease [Deltaproteobacteria bacterium]|nr:ABC transporter permease [Deltaproteobacteria bacterium]
MTFQSILQSIGEFFVFLGQAFAWLFRRPFRFSVFLKQMEVIGVKSTWIVVLVAVFSGGVFALQTGYAFGLFGAQTLVGATVGIALARELAPVFTALMVIARSGSAMAAEIGTMQVNEEVEALVTMAVNPIQYLVTPRLIAGIFMLPLLTGLFNVVGLLGAYWVGVSYLEIPEGPFLSRLDYYLDASDIVQGLIKAALFGLVLTAVSTYQGFHTKNGAEGVGRSTTRAVVISSVAILVLDYFLTTWMLELFPKF